MEFWDKKKCRSRARFEEECLPDFYESCQYKPHLKCIVSDNAERYTCQCGEDDSVYWDSVVKECKPRPDHSEQCQPDIVNSCRHHHQLKCLPSMSSAFHTCQCENTNETYWDSKAKLCLRRFEYGNECNNNVTNSCLHSGHLQCLESEFPGKHICRCVNETTHFWNPNTNSCLARPEHGDHCSKDFINSCKHNDELVCLISSISGDFTCQCDDEEKKFWNTLKKRCITRPSFGDPCKPSFVESCMFPSELKCMKVEGSDNFTCRCSNEKETFWNSLYEVCSDRQGYGETCDEEFPESCLYSPELVCQPQAGFGESICQCVDEYLTYWDPITRVCKSRPDFGNTCEEQESCKFNSQLKCIQSPNKDVKTCQCDNSDIYFWNQNSSVCSKRSSYGGSCLPSTSRSCLHDSELMCLSTDTDGSHSCQCPHDDAMYWDSIVFKCKEKAIFGAPCDDNFTESCSHSDHLKCLPSLSGNTTCQCENGTQLFWNPETNKCLTRPGFGESCDSDYKDSCQYNEYLQCIMSNTSGTYECQCPDVENKYWDNSVHTCKTRKEYGDKCDAELHDSCKHSSELQCLLDISNGSFSCQCMDESALYWDIDTASCRERPGYGTSCDVRYIESCQFQPQLKCVWDEGQNVSTCQCNDESTTFWSQENSTCFQRPVYGGKCRPNFRESCIHKEYLACIFDESGQSTCLCKDENSTYWDTVESICKLRPEYGDSCDADFIDSCKYQDELQCLPSGVAGNNFTCRCPDEENMFWDFNSNSCESRQDYGSTCLPGVQGSCHYEDHLKCLEKDGKYTCRCEREDEIFWDPYMKSCESRPEYGQPCQSEFPSSCKHNTDIRCLKLGGRGNSTCQCINEDKTFWKPDEHKCFSRPEYGGLCYHNGSCMYNTYLECVRSDVSGEHTCLCMDESVQYWDQTVSTCKSRPEYGNECDAEKRNSCKYEAELQCITTRNDTTRSVCQCPDELATYWDSIVKKCTARLTYGGLCDPNFPESCKYDKELLCLQSDTGNYTCRCEHENATYWDPDEKTCSARPLYGDPCDVRLADSCIHNTNLICLFSNSTENSTCQCENESSTFWHPVDTVCKPRPEYGEDCDSTYPGSCSHKSQLLCLPTGGNGSYTCQCNDEKELYWDVSTSTCKQRPQYGDACDVRFKDSCMFNEELLCRTGANNTSTCVCPNETQSFWNNEESKCKNRPTYGGECDANFPDSCSYNEQLTCLQSENSSLTLCQCRDENSTYWDESVSECIQRPEYGGVCNPQLPESCIYKSQLKCMTTNTTNTSICQCADEFITYWDPIAVECIKRPEYGEPCVGKYPDSCQFNSQQQCLPSGPHGNHTCKCADEIATYWDNTSSFCKKRPSYGANCDPLFAGSCAHNSDLSCVTSLEKGNNSVCQCFNETATYWDSKQTKCIERPKYGSKCDTEFPGSCIYKTVLTCVLNDSGNSTCQCENEEATYWDFIDFDCIPRPKYGETCDKEHVDSCQFNYDLKCLPTESLGNFTCRCPDTDLMYWDNENQQCKPRPSYGAECNLDFPDSCRHGNQLRCVLFQNKSICQCQNEIETFWNPVTTTCDQRPGYGQNCLSDYHESCHYQEQLKCLPTGPLGNHTCQCGNENSTYWDSVITECKDRPEYGETCDRNIPDSCNHNSYLKCILSVETNTSTCQCADESESFWHGTTKECKQRPIYGGACEINFPNSCEHKDELECIFSTITNKSVCQCSNESRSFWNAEFSKCLKRPEYGDACDSTHVSSCAYNNELACLYDSVTDTHVCQCRSENMTYWDPTSADCKTRPEFEGQCDLGFPKSCKHNDHLKCLLSEVTGKPTCRCEDVDLLYWDPKLHICETRPEYGENCSKELESSCMYNDQLRCVLNGISSDYVCQCDDESNKYWDKVDLNCNKRPGNDDICDANFPLSCLHNDHLKCLLDVATNTSFCRCKNGEDFYWDSNTNTCKLRSGYNEICDPNMQNNCKGYTGMECLPSTMPGNFSCICKHESTMFWDSANLECKKRPGFESECLLEFPDSCLSSEHLKCLKDSVTGEPVCRCTDQQSLFWDGAVNQCKTRPDHDGVCQAELPDSCKHNEHLKCIDDGDGKNGTCRCQNESQLYWDSSTFQCRPRSGYEQTCNPDLPNSCKRQALLKCLQVGTSDEFSCRCEDENKLFWDSYDAICKKRPKYGASCDSGFPGSCQPKSELLCVLGTTGGGHKCECADERNTFWDPNLMQCKQRPEYGQTCEASHAESCKHNSHLICIKSGKTGNYSCLCNDEKNLFWNAAESVCKLRPLYGSQCQAGMVESCVHNDQLACIKTQTGNHECLCKDEGATYWDNTIRTCRPRPHYGEACNSNLPASCAFNSDLECILSDTGDHICMCADENVTFWDPSTSKCKQRPYYGSVCQPDHPESCLFNDQLQCLALDNENKSTCRCENETASYWDHTSTECKPRLQYGSDCNPDLLNSCEHKTDLKCLPFGNTSQYTCQCADETQTFWDGDELSCSNRTQYGDTCNSDYVDSCRHNKELSCLPTANSENFTCQCKNENDTFWDRKMTSCNQRPEYGDVCKPELPNSCVHNAHLQCKPGPTSGNYTCQCINETSTFWESTVSECSPRPRNRQSCDSSFPDSCQFNSEQKCLYSNESGQHICQCANEISTYWMGGNNKCENRPEYGEECLHEYSDSCRDNIYLTCVLSNTTGKATCQCINETATFWESAKSECKPRPGYGSQCQSEFPESCSPQSELECLTSDDEGVHVCQCKNETSTFWESSKMECSTRTLYGNECLPEYLNSCEHSSELQCLYSNQSQTFVCQCNDEQTTFWDPTSSKCRSRKQYGASCQRDFPESCQPQFQLECLPSDDSENYTCQCRNETMTYWNPSSERCNSRPQYGNQCLGDLEDSCLYNNELSCLYSESSTEYRCQCHNETSSYWNPEENRCNTRPEYGSTCLPEFPKSCQFPNELECVTSENGNAICQCRNESSTFWNTDSNICTPRPEHDGSCDKSFQDSCQPASQLQCLPNEDGYNFTCQCRNISADFWDDLSHTCQPRPLYNEECDPTYPNSCEHNKQLTCSKDTESGKYICQCDNENETFWHNQTSTCNRRPAYDSQCLPEFPESCAHNDQLVCLENNEGNFTCQCVNETSTYWNPNEAMCIDRPSYGQECDTNLTDSCSHNSQLVCIVTENGLGRCQCENETGDYWDDRKQICDTRYEYDQKCTVGGINSCSFSSELQCLLSAKDTEYTCQCRNENSTFWESAVSKCNPRPVYGENCSSSYPDSCQSNTQLICSFSHESGTSICQCADENTTFWETTLSSCEQRPGYGSSCDVNFPESCRYNSDLVCMDTGLSGNAICQCKDEISTYWDSKSSQCKTRPTYGSSCDKDIPGNCEHNEQLRCISTGTTTKHTCQCADEAKTFWDPDSSVCTKRPEYGDTCQENLRDSCMFKSDVVCLPSTTTGEFICQCENETLTFWNPDKQSCNGRPGYGDTCASGLTESCLYNSQLKCVSSPGKTLSRCQCSDEIDTYWDLKTSTCQTRPAYGDECDAKQKDSCRHNSQLNCLKSTTTGLYQCQCSDEKSTFWDNTTETCQERPAYGATCNADIPDSCVHKAELVCVVSSTGDSRCQCQNETTTYWQTERTKCTNRPGYGDICESKFPGSCQHNSDLQCLKSLTGNDFKCQCKNEDSLFWDHNKSKCKPRPKYGEKCQSGFKNSCVHNTELVCSPETQGSDSTCSCKNENSTFWDSKTMDCKIRPEFGESCQAEFKNSCNHNAELQCLPNSNGAGTICRCRDTDIQYWDHKESTCKTRPTYGADCQSGYPDSCMYNEHLKCREMGGPNKYSCRCVDEILLFWDNTTNSCQIRPTTTTPPPVPKGLFFKGDEGVLGDRRVTSKCYIENFTDWESLVISRNNVDMITLSSSTGKLQSNFDRFVKAKPMMRGNKAGIFFRFGRLQCKDEGTYSCAVDGQYTQTAQIVAKTLAKGVPKLSLDGEIFGERRTVFTCSGNPGYPNGKLGWKVKFKDENTFKDFVFHSSRNVVTDTDCVRHEVVNTTFLFTMKWNGAKLRCQAIGSRQYAEVDIWLISENICDHAELNTRIKHPYTRKKYIYCLEERIMSDNCPDGLYFDETRRECVLENQSADAELYSCAGKAPGVAIPDKVDCKKYYLCSHGFKHLRECQHGYFSMNGPPYCVNRYAESFCGTNKNI
ncbi:transmembrane cell adhesion receptor mua-3-like [Ylistrum balloti]|uniref:transmembrane cell adhesion receptor mua-3-like n=1 Tax=Ylistrum balloti TaxID=509963 RepID=UPI002905B703|nr:transmembrane cell adhesion receptor mua-3-like [Ylistrum balloti]